jgi:hypothetical protein
LAVDMFHGQLVAIDPLTRALLLHSTLGGADALTAGVSDGR